MTLVNIGEQSGAQISTILPDEILEFAPVGGRPWTESSLRLMPAFGDSDILKHRYPSANIGESILTYILTLACQHPFFSVE